MLLLSETSQPEIDPNIVFVTSVTYNGNLGGFAGADQKCQTLATATGLPQNTDKAWLSTFSENAIDRLGSARGWVPVDENGANVNDILKCLSGQEPNLMEPSPQRDKPATVGHEAILVQKEYQAVPMVLQQCSHSQIGLIVVRNVAFIVSVSTKPPR